MAASGASRASVVALLCVSCADLPSRPEAVCGNGVLEVDNDEFCDGEEGCVEAGAPGECRFSCADDDCPDGFVCGLDEVCRAPGYVLERGINLGEGEVAHLIADDLDGDGRDDLVWVEGFPGGLRGDLHVAFFDGRDQTEGGYSLIDTPARISTGDADGDGLADILLSDLPAGTTLDTVHPAVLRNDGARDFFPAVATNPDEMVVASQSGGAIYVFLDYIGPASDGTEVDLVRTFVAWIDDDHLAVPGSPSVPALRVAPTAVSSDQDFPEEGPFSVGALATVKGDVDASEIVRDASIDLYPWELHVDGPDQDQVWLGLGDEPVSFSFPEDSPDGLAWVEIARADAKGEGPDLMIQTISPDQLWISVGLGDGLFDGDADGQPDQTISTPFLRMPYHSRVLLSEDINGDGRSDYVSQLGIALSGDECLDETECACDLYDDGTQYSCLWIFTDDQDDLVRLQDVAAADLTGDGHPDFVGIAADDDSGALILYRSTSDHEWEGPDTLPLKTRAVELAQGKVDDNSFPDVLIRTQGVAPGSDELHALWGDAGTVERTQILGGLSSMPGLAIREESIDLALHDGERAGRAQLGRLGRRQFGSLLRLAPDEGYDFLNFYNPRVVNAQAGHFSSTGDSSIALGGWSAGEQFKSHSEQAILASLRSNEHTGGVDFVMHTEWRSFDTPGFHDNAPLPKHASAAGTYLAADFNGDGKDQLVILGSILPVERGPAFVSQGGGFVTAFEFIEGEWFRTAQLSLTKAGDADRDLTVGGEWPRVENPHQAMIEDVDGDGDADLFMLANSSESEEARNYVVVRSLNGYLGLKVESVDDISPGIDAWSFLGPGPDSPQRAAYVSGGKIYVGAFDGEDLSVDDRHEQDAPALVNWSASGDFDGDGLQDLALATSDGVAVYWGVPALASE